MDNLFTNMNRAGLFAATLAPISTVQLSRGEVIFARAAGWGASSESTGTLFSINAKVYGAGEHLQTRAMFPFDAPGASKAGYRMELEIEKADGSKEAFVPPGIAAGDVRGRQAAESIGLGSG